MEIDPNLKLSEKEINKMRSVLEGVTDEALRQILAETLFPHIQSEILAELVRRREKGADATTVDL